MSVLDAVIFDHDGVLVDSETIALEVWRGILDEAEVAYDPAEVMGFVGLTDAAAHATMAGRAGMPSFAGFMQLFETRRDARFAEELQVFPDAYETVRVLAAEGIPLAVATNATRGLLELSLEITGLGRYFQATVASTDVLNGKPAPDVYLEAARRLGVDPHRCLAIEDSPTGARSASEAGMRVVTVARTGVVLEGYATTPSLDPELIMVWLGVR